MVGLLFMKTILSKIPMRFHLIILLSVEFIKIKRVKSENIIFINGCRE